MTTLDDDEAAAPPGWALLGRLGVALKASKQRGAADAFREAADAAAAAGLGRKALEMAEAAEAAEEG